MVKKLIVSLMLIPIMGCSSLTVSSDYPNQKNYGFKKEVTKFSDESGYAKKLSNSHPSDQAYDWAIKDAPNLLQNSKEGDIIEVEGKDNKKVLFAVLSEYPSAGKKLCKKYFVNLDVHLACFNPHWYPVRSFEE